MSEWPLVQPPGPSIGGLGPWRLDLGPLTHIRSITVNYSHWLMHYICFNDIFYLCTADVISVIQFVLSINVWSTFIYPEWTFKQCLYSIGLLDPCEDHHPKRLPPWPIRLGSSGRRQCSDLPESGGCYTQGIFCLCCFTGSQLFIFMCATTRLLWITPVWNYFYSQSDYPLHFTIYSYVAYFLKNYLFW